MGGNRARLNDSISKFIDLTSTLDYFMAEFL